MLYLKIISKHVCFCLGRENRKECCARNYNKFSKNTLQTGINITLLLLKQKVLFLSDKGQPLHMQHFIFFG